MKPTLVILAAGMGSRYGGLKQLDGVGPSGETIMDYSVYDALRAGFGKIVFIIRHDFEQEFRDKVISKYENHVPVEIVFQSIDKIPAGSEYNRERTKPWGTNHAVLMAADVVNEPFGVINADDFYGRESFRILADYLKSADGKKNEYCMVGFIVENTLSKNGSVSRGLCKVSSDNYLTDVVECHGIEEKGEKLIYIADNGTEQEFPAGTIVSMNMWGFTPEYFDYSEKEFINFLKTNGNELKSEFYIPSMVNKLITDDIVRLKVLQTPSKWFGVTFAADKQETVTDIKKLIEAGEYPEKLWK